MLKHFKLFLVLSFLLSVSAILINKINAEIIDETNGDNQDQYIELIDFSNYDKLLKKEDIYDSTDEERIRYINFQGLYPDGDSEAPDFKITYEDMQLNSWLIDIFSYDEKFISRIEKNKYLYVWDGKGQTKKPIQNHFYREIKEDIKKDSTVGVLKVKFYIPTDQNNIKAIIHPRFEIVEFDKKGKLSSLFNGVFPNIRQIKKIRLNIYGKNMDNFVAVRLKDSYGNVAEFPMGYIQPKKYKTTLVWDNASFIPVSKERYFVKFPYTPIDSNNFPYYSRIIPYVKFDSIVVYSSRYSLGKNIEFYINKIEIDAEPFLDMSRDRIISDEEFWGIETEFGLNMREIYRKRIAGQIREEIILEKKSLLN